MTRDQRGAVTAELALGIPMLMAVTIGLVWLLSIGVAQIMAVDAARETARAVARGDSADEAVVIGQRVAPDGARVTVSTTDGMVVATVTGRVPGPPGRLFGSLPGARLHAEATTTDEAAMVSGLP